MDLENTEINTFLRSAQQHQLRYMLIGGYALNLHGINRFTADADVWIAPTHENKALFLKVLLDLGYSEEDIEDIANQDFTQPFVCSIGDLPFSIDILTVVHRNINFDDCEIRKQIYQTESGVSYYFLHLDDLRETKILSRRPQYYRDIALIDEHRQKKK